MKKLSSPHVMSVPNQSMVNVIAEIHLCDHGSARSIFAASLSSSGQVTKSKKSLKLKFIITFAGCMCSEPAPRKARNLGASEEVDAALQSADYKVTRDASHYVNCECHAVVC